MKVIYYFIYLSQFIKCVVSTKTAPTSGLYRYIPYKIDDCKKTSYPQIKDSPVTVDLELFNTSTRYNLLRGAITCSRPVQKMKIKLKGYAWSNGKWKLIYLVNNISCNGVLFNMFFTTLGVKYDKEHCGFGKGQYNFTDIDPDKLQHLWLSKMEYGRRLWVSEFCSGSVLYCCKEFESQIEPL